MRICMIAYTFYETDNRVKRYAETLVRRGDEVDVIALKKETRSACSDILNDVNIFRIQKRTVNEKRKLTYLMKLGLFFIKATLFLTKQHMKKKYDLIHVHNVPDFLVFAAFLPKLTGAKIILDIHDILPEFYSDKFNANKGSFTYKLIMIIEKTSIAFADHVIISNHIWEKTLVGRSIKKEKCTVIMNYPDPFIFYKQHHDMKKNKFIIMYPGSLNKHQGLDIAIKAFKIVRDQISNTEFQIYGEGGTKDSLVDLVAQLEMGNDVIFRESLPIDEIAERMTFADLAIIPKRADSFGNEAFSTKILEFMSLGVPIIASKTKIDQYYFDESLVAFFESGNEIDLAEKIILLIGNENLRKKKISNSLHYIEKNNWNVKKNIYLNLVDSLSR